jgi:hypothetical protein
MTSTCWLWHGGLIKGYGAFHVNGKLSRAHIFAYTTFIGPVPEGKQLDHICRVRRCCNPEHVEPVTRRVNILRGESFAAHNATVTHCPKGHPYDEANTVRHKLGRNCRECRRQGKADRRAKAKMNRYDPLS